MHGDQESLKEFVRYWNNAHPTIKFTYECSDSTVNFLDLTLYKGPRFNTDNKLDTKPYFKSTDKFQYLMYSSAHPRNTFRSLIKGELTRLLRACSDEQQYSLIKNKILVIFKQRGYPHHLIYQAIYSVPFNKRGELLTLVHCWCLDMILFLCYWVVESRLLFSSLETENRLNYIFSGSKTQ